MLVLTRHIGESVIVDDDITVTILGLAKGEVRIGIDAPKTINIVREEVLRRNTKLSIPMLKSTIAKKNGRKNIG